MQTDREAGRHNETNRHISATYSCECALKDTSFDNIWFNMNTEGHGLLKSTNLKIKGKNT
jgi:hypothetical protein